MCQSLWNLNRVECLFNSYVTLQGSCRRRASLVEPGQDVASDALDIVVQLPKEQGVEHPVVYLDGLVLAGGGLVQGAADFGVGDLVGAAVQDEERDGDLAEAHGQLVGGAQQLDDGAEPGAAAVAHGVARRNDALGGHLDGLLDEVGGGHDGGRGREPRDEGEDLRQRPRRADPVGDPAHGRDEDGPRPLLGRRAEVDEQADGAAHGLPEEEAGQARVLLPRPDGAEEGEDVGDGGVEVGNEGAEAVGAAVAREVGGEAGEPGPREEDRRGLERPADVVAVAVDHEDERLGARRRAGSPRPREEPPGALVWRGEVGRLALRAVRGVVVRLRGRVVPPEVDGQRRRRRRRVPVRRHGGDQGLVPDGGVGWGCGVDGELLVAGKWGSRCCCCQLRSVAAGEKFGCGTGLLDSFRGLGVGREPIARTIDPWRRSTL